MNGKTIGRMKLPRDSRSAEDMSEPIHYEPDETERTAARAEASRLTSDHRYALAQNATLKRDLAVAQSRLELLLKGGDPFNAMKPIGAAHIREAEFERIVLSMEDMTPEARLRHISKLIEDTRSYVARREDWKKSLDAAK